MSCIQVVALYSIESEATELSSIFQNLNDKGMVFADWLSGVFIVVYGHHEEKDESTGYSEFVEDEYTFLSLKNGVILKSYTVGAGIGVDEISNHHNIDLVEMYKKWSESMR